MRKWDWAILVAATFASGALSLALGQDLNFDQRHYHIYLGWSLLAGRLDLDVAPAAVGTYLNPVIHVPTYLGTTFLPPRVFGALLGATHGVNLFLVYLVALRMLPPAVRHRRTLAALAAVMAGIGPNAVSLVGTTFGDNLVSIPMLAGVLALAGAVESPGGPGRPGPSLRLVALSAGLAGAAAGLKLTFVFLWIPLALVALGLAAWARSWRVAVVFGAASALGFLLAAGYWASLMWTRFSNPLFPFANDLFRSPYHLSSAGRDPQWASHGWADPLVEAVNMATGQTRGLQQVAFADPRYLVLLLLAALALACRVIRRVPAMPVAARLVVLYWGASYVVWLSALHYYRYFTVGEYLAPAVLLALLAGLLRRGLLVVWLALVVAVGACSHTRSWQRGSWGKQWYRVRFDSPPVPGAVVMLDGPMTSFVAPYFPEGTRFFGVVPAGLRPLNALVTERLRTHRGAVYRLRPAGRPPSPLESLGLADTDECAPVHTGGTRLVLCRLERTSRSP